MENVIFHPIQVSLPMQHQLSHRAAAIVVVVVDEVVTEDAKVVDVPVNQGAVNNKKILYLISYNSRYSEF